ncbi:hypothetical protein E2562_037396 [Oryza meyeriana var. granulata]|uniref:Uncharacterized protein n=1 Tax=Oryza meyeriana var. granulata TaxID=110450 RepID=A0A6G1DAZ9_9ORYZ|nr:hypothetical protein E2562_037396 [Oryza meyeriana var. granulata]
MAVTVECMRLMCSVKCQPCIASMSGFVASVAQGNQCADHNQQKVEPGNIIVRQRGTCFHPGNYVGMGKDHTLFCLKEGHVRFERNKLTGRKWVHVDPVAGHVLHPVYASDSTTAAEIEPLLCKAWKSGNKRVSTQQQHNITLWHVSQASSTSSMTLLTFWMDRPPSRAEATALSLSSATRRRISLPFSPSMASRINASTSSRRTSSGISNPMPHSVRLYR